MDLIEKLRKRLIDYNKKLNNGEYIRVVLSDNEAYIADMNAQVQLFEQGVNNLGVKISDYAPYSPITIDIKRLKGQPTNRVTLRDEGDFEASFYLDIGKDKFEIKASDEKTEWLLKKYGRQILGLTEEHIEEVAWEYLYPELLDKLKKAIYGN